MAPTAAVPDLSLAEVLGIARVSAPPLGTGLRIHADFPAGRPYDVDGTRVTSLTVDITPTGDVLITRMIAKPASSGSTSGDGTNECEDGQFTPEGVKWDRASMPLRWTFDYESAPAPLYKRRTEGKLIEAHAVWQNTYNRCDDADSIDFAYEYAGRSWRGVRRDGVNSVGFGSLGGEALAVNYLWYQGTTAVETDLRFRKRDWMWSNRPERRDRYQVINVATHELGHQIGLDDLGHDHSRLTMYGIVGRGELSKVSLGRGDVRGATLLSPRI
jgi:hypothetical protein